MKAEDGKNGQKLLIAKRLAEARRERRMTQKDLADATGTALNTVWRWESGEALPRHNSLVILSETLKVPLEYFTESDEHRALDLRSQGQPLVSSLPGGLRTPRPDTALLPFAGMIGAGNFVEAIEDPTQYFPCTPEHAKVADGVGQVVGDSMHPDLQDGDYVAVKIQQHAESGDVVLAKLNNETAVKIYRDDAHGKRLESVNPIYPPLKDGFQIIGVVTWMHRAIKTKR